MIPRKADVIRTTVREATVTRFIETITERYAAPTPIRPVITVEGSEVDELPETARPGLVFARATHLRRAVSR